MKKKIDISLVENSLRGESVFFPTKENEPAPESAGEPIESKPQEIILPQQPLSPKNGTAQNDIPHHNESMQSSMHASLHASTLAENEHIQTIVKTLRLVGKEVLYVRSTIEEKEQVKEIVHSYERKRIKTSDNEIGRIALNFILEDYKLHGDESILAKVLEKLHI
jgi:hypothetical protein